MAYPLLMSCASSRTATASKYEAETERDSTATHTTASAAATTAQTTTASTATTKFATKGTTASNDTATAVEVTTVATAYDTAGRVVSVRTEKRTNTGRRTVADRTTNGDISRWLTDTATAKAAATATTSSAHKNEASAKTKGTRKEVITVGKPWYYWPVRIGAALLAAVLVKVLSGPALAAWGWFALIFRKKKQAAPAEDSALS